jgi:sugar phosphate isomerase/epimerase
MRIGAILDQTYFEDPYELAYYYCSHGFRAADYPHAAPYTSKNTEELQRIRAAFEKYDVVIGEMSAWRNPFDPDPVKAKESVDYIIDRLVMADEVNAICAAEMVGNLCPDTGNVGAANFSDDFYARSVDMTRHIIDTAAPKRAKLGFEVFPFNFLDSTDMYIKYIKDVDRPQITAHLDAINLINCPRLYCNNAAVMRDAVKRLAPFGVGAMHLKDLVMHQHQPNTWLEEVPLGQGGLDIPALLKAIDEFLPKDTAVLMEHLPDHQYNEVLPVVKQMGKSVGIDI